ALVAAKRANKNGNEEKYRYFVPYKNRAEIFSNLGLKDSALYYARLGYELELEELKQSNNQKIIEIDARYNYEKKAQQLREQEQLLVYEKERQSWLIRLCIFALFCFATITYYYLSLRKANKKTHEQAKEITKANQDLSVALQHQIDLQGEVHHRVKNNLQVIISLMELQSEEIKDPIALNQLKSMSNRIFSMAAIHDLLYQKKADEEISFRGYIENLCNHFRNFSHDAHPVTFSLDIDEQHFNLQTLMPLGIILNELLTNSLKYGRVEGKELSIHIEVQKQEDAYCLRYKDNGPGLPQGQLVEREGGLGTYLLKSMCRQLNGHFLSKSENGAEFEVIFNEINKS
ncbi:MAG: sensor histidine kinase, partial [Bacteroidota bacterium]